MSNDCDTNDVYGSGGYLIESITSQNAALHIIQHPSGVYTFFDNTEDIDAKLINTFWGDCDDRTKNNSN